MKNRIGQIIRKYPLLPTVGALICAILNTSESPYFIILAIIISLLPFWLGMKRLCYFCLIVCVFGAIREAQCEKELLNMQNFSVRKSDEVSLITGSVVRVLNSSVWIRPDNTSALIEANFGKDIPAKLGERWQLEGITSPILPPNTPGAFDRQGWLHRQHVGCHLDVLRSQKLGTGDWLSNFRASSESLRNQAAKILSIGAPKDSREAGIVISLMFGDKRFLPQDDYLTFKESGCLHIFAVSGMHIGMVSLILLSLARLLPIHPNKAKIICIPLLGLYVYVTGMPVSAMRAFLMISLVFLASSLRRNKETLNTLALAAIIILLWDPFQIGDAGFQLSFIIFAVLLWTLQWQKALPPWWSPDSFIPSHCYTKVERTGLNIEGKVRAILLVSFACWLVAMPITAAHFGTINLYSPLSGILMGAFLFPLMSSALMSIFLNWIPYASALINIVSRFIAHILFVIASWVADQPYSLIPCSMPADPGEALVMSLTRQQSITMLGSQGLLINAGSGNDTYFRIIPALKNLGFSPHLFILPHNQKGASDGIKEIFKEWNNISILDQSQNQMITHPSGQSVHILKANQDFATGIEADKAPIIRWEYANHSLLYLGDAAFSLSQKIPTDQLKADIIIIGWHKHDPFSMNDWIQATGARHVIILNNEEDDRLSTVTDSTLPYRIYRLSSTPILLIKLREEGVDIRPWTPDEPQASRVEP